MNRWQDSLRQAREQLMEVLVWLGANESPSYWPEHELEPHPEAPPAVPREESTAPDQATPPLH